MGRKGHISRREVDPDPKYLDPVITRFVNTIMIQGKKSIAERMFYEAIDAVSERVGDDGLKVFRKAIDNVKPMLEVKSRRVGGANYQVPVEVKPERRQSLAIRWIMESARGRTEHTFGERLAAEFIEAAEGRGGAIKKREDIHRMAEANKAFSHFRW